MTTSQKRDICVNKCKRGFLGDWSRKKTSSSFIKRNISEELYTA